MKSLFSCNFVFVKTNAPLFGVDSDIVGCDDDGRSTDVVTVASTSYTVFYRHTDTHSTRTTVVVVLLSVMACHTQFASLSSSSIVCASLSLYPCLCIPHSLNCHRILCKCISLRPIQWRHRLCAHWIRNTAHHHHNQSTIICATKRNFIKHDSMKLKKKKKTITCQPNELFVCIYFSNFFQLLHLLLLLLFCSLNININELRSTSATSTTTTRTFP